jgi:hypothetical protein
LKPAQNNPGEAVFSTPGFTGKAVRRTPHHGIPLSATSAQVLNMRRCWNSFSVVTLLSHFQGFYGENGNFLLQAFVGNEWGA